MNKEIDKKSNIGENAAMLIMSGFMILIVQYSFKTYFYVNDYFEIATHNFPEITFENIKDLSIFPKLFHTLIDKFLNWKAWLLNSVTLLISFIIFQVGLIVSALLSAPLLWIATLRYRIFILFPIILVSIYVTLMFNEYNKNFSSNGNYFLELIIFKHISASIFILAGLVTFLFQKSAKTNTIIKIMFWDIKICI